MGAPLILNDPIDTINAYKRKQIVYHSTNLESYAIDAESGKIIWHTKPNIRFVDKKIPKNNHMWGLNYHPNTDSLIGVLMSGEIFAIDRKTGKSIVPSFQLPRSPSIPSSSAKPPKWMIDRGNHETDQSFGKLLSGKSIYESVLQVIFGGDACVSNYFAIDQNTGNIFIVATAPDSKDNTLDGFSEYGALYHLNIHNDSF